MGKIKIVANPKFEAFVRSDLVSVGSHPEDGSPLEGEVFYVVCERRGGYRWAHEKNFEASPCPACLWEALCASDSDETIVSTSCLKHAKDPGYSRAQAQEAAQALADRINAAYRAGEWRGPEGSKHWRPIEPCYGSVAWQETGADARRLADEVGADDSLAPSEKAAMLSSIEYNGRLR